MTAGWELEVCDEGGTLEFKHKIEDAFNHPHVDMVDTNEFRLKLGKAPFENVTITISTTNNILHYPDYFYGPIVFNDRNWNIWQLIKMNVTGSGADTLSITGVGGGFDAAPALEIQFHGSVPGINYRLQIEKNKEVYHSHCGFSPSLPFLFFILSFRHLRSVY